MKQFIKCSLILCILSIYSCSRDLGNYDYTEINEVSIEEIPAQQVIYKIDTLTLRPTLHFSIDSVDMHRYQYEWKVVSSGTSNTYEVIANTRDLNYPVSILPGAYRVYYKVLDTKTDLIWKTNFDLNVMTETTRGFLLIGENEDQDVEVEMISMLSSDTLILRELMHDNGLPKIKGAVNIVHTGGYFNPTNIRLWVMGQTGAYYINSSTFMGDPQHTFQSMNFTTFPSAEERIPVEIAPHVAVSTGGTASSSYRVVITNNGDAFFCNLNLGEVYGNPINRPSANSSQTFSVSPYIFYPSGFWSRFILYDTEQNRFVMSNGLTATFMNNLADGPSDIFPWNQSETKRTLIYGENTRNTDGGSSNGNSFALMKDDQSDYFIYKFYVATVPEKRGFYPIKTSYSSLIEQASNFAFSSSRSILFYSIGNKLYAYDYNRNNERNVLVKEFTDEITLLNCDIQTGNYYDLYVGTYSPQEKGSLRKFVLTQNPNTITLEETEGLDWTNLSKLKKMYWRNSKD